MLQTIKTTIRPIARFISVLSMHSTAIRMLLSPSCCESA